MSRVTIGNLRVTVGHIRVTVGHHGVTIGVILMYSATFPNHAS